VDAQELDAQVAGRMAYISNILLKAIADGELENRVTALEKRLSNRQWSNLLELKKPMARGETTW
jgi:hypothetical protein